jgi:hypothetical protein
MSKKVFVTITFNGISRSYLMDAHIDANGKATVSQAAVDKILDNIGCRRGDAYTIG